MSKRKRVESVASTLSSEDLMKECWEETGGVPALLQEKMRASGREISLPYIYSLKSKLLRKGWVPPGDTTQANKEELVQFSEQSTTSMSPSEKITRGLELIRQGATLVQEGLESMGSITGKIEDLIQANLSALQSMK